MNGVRQTEKALEPASVVDGLFAIANALNRIAGAIGSSRHTLRKRKKMRQPSLNYADKVRWKNIIQELGALARTEIPVAPSPEWPAPFNMPVSELDELSVRAKNCFERENIIFVGDLVQKTEPELLRIQHFGRKCLYEVNEALIHMGLRLGMTLQARYDSHEGGAR
jgi:DNA-directed RNA polymerase alpha subunit